VVGVMAFVVVAAAVVVVVIVVVALLFYFLSHRAAYPLWLNCLMQLLLIGSSYFNV
jgi:Na+/serine symporter